MVDYLKENLITNRLILSPPYLTKAEQLLSFYLHNRTFHAPFENIKPDEFYTLHGIKALLQHQIQDQDSKRGLYFALSLSDCDEVIGTISCSNIVYGPFCSTFLGYRLSHSTLHHGYMREALESVISFGCKEYNLHRFEANIMTDSKASLI